MKSATDREYDCPFCKIADGGEDRYTNQNDIIYKDAYAMAVIAPRWWVNNPGSVLVFPLRHHENIYVIDDYDLAQVYLTVKKVSIALREVYDCESTSNRQHNERAAGQDV